MRFAEPRPCHHKVTRPGRFWGKLTPISLDFSVLSISAIASPRGSVMLRNLRVVLPALVLTAIAFWAAPQRASAQVSLTTLGTPSTQSFDTLPRERVGDVDQQLDHPGLVPRPHRHRHHDRGQQRLEQRRQPVQLRDRRRPPTGRSAPSARATPRSATSSGAFGCRTTLAPRSPRSTSPTPASSGATARRRRRPSPSPTWWAAPPSPVRSPSSSRPAWRWPASISPARSPAAASASPWTATSRPTGRW